MCKPAPWFTTNLGGLKEAGRLFQWHWLYTCTKSDNLYYSAHWRTYEVTVTAAKKYNNSATITLASSQPFWLFKVIQHLLMPKSDLLLSQEETITNDTFAKVFFLLLLLRTYKKYTLLWMSGTPEDRTNTLPGLFMDHLSQFQLYILTRSWDQWRPLIVLWIVDYPSS